MLRRKINKLVLLLLPVFLLVLIHPSFANSLPVYWQGYPSIEVLTVDKNSPIEVKSEHLLFDLSAFNKQEYTISGRVTATYEMFNPTDENVTVQMAFPFISKVNNFSKEDISILADNVNIPFDIYIGETVESYGAPVDLENISLDFSKLTETITAGHYQGKNFSETDEGILYTFEVEPKIEEGMHFSVEFTEFDKNSTKIVADSFNSIAVGQNHMKVSGWCLEKTTFEVFILGKQTDFKIEAYTDGSHREKTDKFTCSVSQKVVNVKSFIEDMIEKVRAKEEYSAINPNNILNIDRSQIYRMYISAMDKALSQNAFATYGDLAGQFTVNRLIFLVYSVQFHPNSSRTVSVSYDTIGTMDTRKTSKPLYTFTYFLTPARYWASFRNLDIEIITPSQAPYIVQSSIDLENIKPGHYVANLSSLPENNLFFTIHSDKEIKFLKNNIFSNKYTDSLLSSTLVSVILMLILLVLGTVLVYTIRRYKK